MHFYLISWLFHYKNPGVWYLNLNFILTRNKKVEQYIKRIYKYNVLRFWVEGGVLVWIWLSSHSCEISVSGKRVLFKYVNGSTSEECLWLRYSYLKMLPLEVECTNMEGTLTWGKSLVWIWFNSHSCEISPILLSWITQYLQILFMNPKALCLYHSILGSCNLLGNGYQFYFPSSFSTIVREKMVVNFVFYFVFWSDLDKWMGMLTNVLYVVHTIPLTYDMWRYYKV